MRALQTLTARFRHEESGATAIEYGLIAALVAVAIIAGLNALGASNGGSWTNTADKASTAMSN